MFSAILILSAFLLASGRTAYKVCMRHSDDIPLILVSQTVAALIGLPIFFFTFPKQTFSWPLLILESFFWVGLIYFEIRSFRYLDLGVAAVLAGLEYILHMLIGVFFFAEPLTTHKLIGMLVIFVGLVSSADWRIPQMRKGAVYQIAASLCAALAFPIDTILVREVSPWFIAAFSFLGPSLTLLLWRREERAAAWKLAKTSRASLLSGLLNLSGYLLLLLVVSSASYISTMSHFQIMTCFSVALGFLVLGEKEHLLRKVAACVLVVVGSSLVA